MKGYATIHQTKQCLILQKVNWKMTYRRSLINQICNISSKSELNQISTDREISYSSTFHSSVLKQIL